MRRTLAIGDIHGCRDELSDLLKLIEYRPDADRLVFVGDLVDRGPDPAGVVRLVRTLQANGDVQVVMGNHDEKAARWFHNVEKERRTGKANAMQPPKPKRLAEWEALTTEDVAWLQALPVTCEPLPGWIAVHAGFEGFPRQAQRPDKMMRVRWISPETGKMAPFEHGSLDQPAGSIHWSERWTGPENVVYGHAVHSLTDPRIDRVNGVEVWGIDTGACFGGRLTALCLETREVFQVQARRAYAELGREIHP